MQCSMETIIKVKDRIHQLQSKVDYNNWRISEIRAVQKMLPFSSVIYLELNQEEEKLLNEIDRYKMIIRNLEDSYSNKNVTLIIYNQ